MTDFVIFKLEKMVAEDGEDICSLCDCFISQDEIFWLKMTVGEMPIIFCKTCFKEYQHKPKPERHKIVKFKKIHNKARFIRVRSFCKGGHKIRGHIRRIEK